jgi:hypothetical protein
MAQARVFNNTTQTDSQVTALKLPPHSIEAEQSLIGGLLLDNTAWDRVGDAVSEADFYRDDHRRIFIHIRKLVESGRPADVVTVYESIEKSNEVDQTGGLSYLGEIANNTPSAANIRRYAEIVHERAVLRKLVTVGDEIAASALESRRARRQAFAGRCRAARCSRSPRPARKYGTGLRRPSRPLLGKVVDKIQQLYDRDNPFGHHRRADRFHRSRQDDLGPAARATSSSSPAAHRWARPRSRSTSPSTSASSWACRSRSFRLEMSSDRS